MTLVDRASLDLRVARNLSGGMGKNVRIHLLDPGSRMYGDAVLVEIDGKTVLIDGNHPGDERPGRKTLPVQEQIAEVLGLPLPITVDLLVVTHCHSDHVGCLPELFASRMLAARHALVADELLGFGRLANEPATDLSPDAVVTRVAAALREEPRGGFRTDAEISEFISDAATVESRYRSLLTQLEQDGVTVVRQGRDKPAALNNLLRKVGIRSLKILGPSDEQLFLCAEAIRRFTADVVDLVAKARQRDAQLGEVELYKRLAGSPGAVDLLLDAPGKGAALNDQSILIAIGQGTIDPASINLNQAA